MFGDAGIVVEIVVLNFFRFELERPVIEGVWVAPASAGPAGDRAAVVREKPV